MEKEKQILDEVEKTLQAFNHVPNLEANPFLFTRIQARLASERGAVFTARMRTLHLKPIALAVIVILNIITAVSALKPEGTESTKEELISSLNQEYNSARTEF